MKRGYYQIVETGEIIFFSNRRYRKPAYIEYASTWRGKSIACADIESLLVARTGPPLHEEYIKSFNGMWSVYDLKFL